MLEPRTMTVVEEEVMAANPVRRVISRVSSSRWTVDWSAVWVGALSAVMVGLIIGLIAVAVGAQGAADARIVRWSDFGLGSLIFAVCGAFLSFVVGGWVAGRMTGFLRAEPTILHGAIAWLLGASLMVAVAATGATPFGPWHRGVIAIRPPTALTTPTATPADPDAARAARNTALGGVAALLLGLAGATVGGWMASGEPMTFTHYRSRERQAA
jgi:hypothetical protein